jgi:4-hydroxybenzoate polyprenyltransferase/phosphoserine phosphatase
MIPLVLDLDGTTVLTDTLIDNALRVLADSPLAFLRLLPRAFASRARFKQDVARLHALDPATLAYNPDILALAAEARADGRHIYLVTAADTAVAERVAAHLGLFDGVFASDGQTNLKGDAKAAKLIALFGLHQFDYAGDAAADRPVWRAAHEAILVNAPAALRAQVQAECTTTRILGTPLSAWPRARLIAKALRVHQWAKNLLLLAPMLAAHQARLGTAWHALLGFIAFSLCASSVYLLNDLVDLPNDRAHATKRRRPFASGALDLRLAPALMALLLGGAALIAALLPANFLVMLLVYYACTLAYSFVLKRLMVWDIIMLAGLYTIRVFAGGAATDIAVSPWLLAFAMFLFFCLAVVKRLTELTTFARGGGTAKLKGRGYLPEDLAMLRSMAASSGYMAVMVMALYVNGNDMHTLYRHPAALWALCPILLFWVSRVLMLADRGEMHEDPVVFALRDRTSLLTGAAALVAIVAATL